MSPSHWVNINYWNNLLLYVQRRLAVEAVSKPVCVHCRDQCSIVLFWIVCKDMLPIRIHWILNCILIADLFPRHCPLRHKENNIFSITKSITFNQIFTANLKYWSHVLCVVLCYIVECLWIISEDQPFLFCYLQWLSSFLWLFCLGCIYSL